MSTAKIKRGVINVMFTLLGLIVVLVLPVVLPVILLWYTGRAIVQGDIGREGKHERKT